MRSFKKIYEDESIFIESALKWTFLSIIIGVLVGGFTTLFVKTIEISVDFIIKFKFYYLFIPAALFLSNFIINKLAPDAKGHGTEKAIESVNKNNGNMKIAVVPVKLLTTFITIISGGSVGLEGPATQIGGAISSFIGQVIKMNSADKRRLVVCGISAGFVSVFNAPVGAAIFACEVLYIGKLSYISILPSLISSFTSYYIGIRMGNKPLAFNIKYIPANTVFTFLYIFIFGILIGILAILFIKLIKYTEKFFRKFNHPYLRGVAGGIFILALTFIFNSHEGLGIGDGIINRIISGEKFSSVLFINKSLTTALTLGSGGSGGILTPMLFIGSAFGNVWAQIIGSDISFYSAIGMVAFLGACSNIPISSIIIAMELFGNSIGIYASIAIGISYVIVGHESIYPTQLIIDSKTPSVYVDPNVEINDIGEQRRSEKEHLIKKFFIQNHENKHS